MRKENSSLWGCEAASKSRHIPANPSTIVFNNPSSHQYQALQLAEGGDKPAPAVYHPPSRRTSLPYSSHCIMEHSNVGFGSNLGSDGETSTNMMILGKSTDGSLRLYQSSYTNGIDVHETSQAQPKWGQKEACHDN